MSTIIVSYDGTPNDDDALALGRLLAQTGAGLALAYVRHAHETDPAREEVAQHDAERRLEQGAAWLGNGHVPQHVVLSASTRDGLAELAAAQDAALIVFGSEYRTAPGHVEPGTTAQHLLEGGSIPIAVARAGLRTRNDAAIASIAVSAVDTDPAAEQTARALAGKLGASVVQLGRDDVDLIITASQPTAPEGRIALSGTSRAQLNTARGSVIVLPRGRAALV
jgi:nucleotide-binding universal stress UspA family protein